MSNSCFSLRCHIDINAIIEIVTSVILSVSFYFRMLSRIIKLLTNKLNFFSLLISNGSELISFFKGVAQFKCLLISYSAVWDQAINIIHKLALIWKRLAILVGRLLLLLQNLWIEHTWSACALLLGLHIDRFVVSSWWFYFSNILWCVSWSSVQMSSLAEVIWVSNRFRIDNLWSHLLRFIGWTLTNPWARINWSNRFATDSKIHSCIFIINDYEWSTVAIRILRRLAFISLVKLSIEHVVSRCINTQIGFIINILIWFSSLVMSLTLLLYDDLWNVWLSSVIWLDHLIVWRLDVFDHLI